MAPMSAKSLRLRSRGECAIREMIGFGRGGGVPGSAPVSAVVFGMVIAREQVMTCTLQIEG